MGWLEWWLDWAAWRRVWLLWTGQHDAYEAALQHAVDAELARTIGE